ncbi:MAG: hypothetical protein ACRDTU_23080 [Micromonosporaceae bacterium]
MTGDARKLLDRIRDDLPPAEQNRLVPMIDSGEAPLSTIAALAAEEHHIVTSDQRSFLLLAARAREPKTTDLFTGLGQGEGVALATIPALAAAAGMSTPELLRYEPQPGCQAYPSYVGWLSINAEPGDVVVAMAVNFAAFGEYCATIAAALRREYGFDDEACAFFDFFGNPPPELETQILGAIQAELDARRITYTLALRYCRLLQSYELAFWNTLADSAET